MDTITLNLTRWLSDLPAMILTQQFGMDCPDAELSRRPRYGFYAHVGAYEVGRFDGEIYLVGIRRHDEYQAYTAEDALRSASHLTQAARLCERFNRANGRIPAIPAHMNWACLTLDRLSWRLSDNDDYDENVIYVDISNEAIEVELDSEWEVSHFKPDGRTVYIHKETRS